MWRTIYVFVLASFLLVSGLWHVVMPTLTDHWMKDARVVRAVGALLLALAIPWLVWPGWFFRALLLGLVVSGIWRLHKTPFSCNERFIRGGYTASCSSEARS